MHRIPFSLGRWKADRIGGCIHSDVVSPMSYASLAGTRYFKMFKDDYSGFFMVFFMKQKSDVLTHCRSFVTTVKTQTGNTVETLKSDKEGECLSKEFTSWLLELGVRQETSAPYTPAQNGIAERWNGTAPSLL